MATMSPELILASYSWARRDHIVRLTRARPFSVSSARLTIGGSASLRMPTETILRGANVSSPRHPRLHLSGDVAIFEIVFEPVLYAMLDRRELLQRGFS